MLFKTAATLGLVASVSAHSVIIKAVGDAGGQGAGLGMDPSIPRDGTRRRPFQQDSTRFKGDQADTLGETLGGGNNDVETGVKAIMAMTGGQPLPQVKAGGMLMMTLHQVNTDGGGTYTCSMSTDTAATTWTDINVTTSPPGDDRGNNRDTQMQDLPLNVQIPAGTQCTGTAAGQQNVCLVKCMNGARAGPFGGTVAMQIASASSGNSTASATRKLRNRAPKKMDAALRQEKSESMTAEEEFADDPALLAELRAQGEDI